MNLTADIQACFQTAYGTHTRPEAMVMQKVLGNNLLLSLLTSTEKYNPDEWPPFY